jgi:hypothetical protein
MANQLLQLKVVSTSGDPIERELIVTAAMPLYHLHRVLQFAIQPRQTDDGIAALVSWRDGRHREEE